MISMIPSLTNEQKRTMVFLVISAASVLVSFLDIRPWLLDPAWIAVVLCGLPIIKGAIEGIITEFDIRSDVLVSIALLAAIYIGEVFAAGEVAFIMALGGMLEELTVAKARSGIQKLVNISPRTARKLVEGREQTVPAEEVQPGDLLRVLAGETIAVDGIITSGRTSIDTSVMTGESMPVDREPGDEVFSGTVNRHGAFDMEATRVGEDSSLQRMIRLVESSDAGKAKIVRMADKWATWIVIIALASALGTWWATGEIIRAVTILVVFCPCALVLATPTAIAAGIGNASRYGILIQEGDALERLSRVSKIAFDKTGTLTCGQPAVVAAEILDVGIEPESFQQLVAAAEKLSEHPLGQAIASHARDTLGLKLIDPDEFSVFPGGGVRAVLGSDSIISGSEAFLKECGISIPASIAQDADRHRETGSTVVFAAINGTIGGFFALADTLRPDSIETVRMVHEQHFDTLLLTGDHHQTAAYIGHLAGVGTVHSECLPEDKVFIIEDYHKREERVCMIGDGINDAPALKIAYVGVAMAGIGSDIAIEAADIALVSDNVRAIPHLMGLARKTMQTVKINLVFSMLLNFAAILLAMAGILGPVPGALVHNAGSVIVVVNAALLLNYRLSSELSGARP